MCLLMKDHGGQGKSEDEGKGHPRGGQSRLLMPLGPLVRHSMGVLDKGREMLGTRRLIHHHQHLVDFLFLLLSLTSMVLIDNVHQ